MKRQILVNVNANDFTYYKNKPIVAGDANAYEIVLVVPYDVEGSVFSVTAIKPDAVHIVGAQVMTDATASYVLKNNMYDVAGDTTFRLTLTKDATVLTAAELIVPVVVANGEPDLAGDDRVPALSSLIALTSTAVAGANQAAADADQAKTALLAAAENGDFDGADGAPGPQGPAGTWDTTTEYPELTTEDKTIPEAINELNSGKADKTKTLMYVSEYPVLYEDIDSITTVGCHKIDMGNGYFANLNIFMQTGEKYQSFLNTIRKYHAGIGEWEHRLSGIMPISSNNEASNGLSIRTNSSIPDIVPVMTSYDGSLKHYYNFSDGDILITNNGGSTVEYLAKKNYVDNLVGDIGALLDIINGEVV